MRRLAEGQGHVRRLARKAARPGNFFPVVLLNAALRFQ